MPESNVIFDDETVESFNRITAGTRREGLGTKLQSGELRGYKYYTQNGKGPGDFSNQASAVGHLSPSSFPRNISIIGAFVRVNTPFSGGSVTDVTIELGDSDDRDRHAAAKDVTSSGVKDGEATATSSRSFRGNYTPTATIRTTGGNIQDLTAGDVDIFWVYMDCDHMVNP